MGGRWLQTGEANNFFLYERYLYLVIFLCIYIKEWKDMKGERDRRIRCDVICTAFVPQPYEFQHYNYLKKI